MKKINFIITTIAISFVFFVSCNNCIDGVGNVVKTKRGLNRFEKINIEVPADITIKNGDTTTVLIEAQKNITDKITTKVKRNTLFVSSSCYKTDKRVKMTITVKSLKTIAVKGTAHVKVFNALTSETVNLHLSGSGKIETDVLTPKTDIKIDGSGVIIINGTTKEIDAEISGTGKLRALGLRTDKAYATVNGSGEMFITANELLKAKIDGSGIIHYSGSPNIRTKINGTGKVSKID